MSRQKWVTRSLILALLLGGIVPQVAAQQPGQPANVIPAAVVNGESIPMSDVEAIMRARGPSAVPTSDVQRKQMQFTALEMLIDDMLMQQFLRKNGPKIDPAEITKRFAELEDGLKKQGKSLQDFYRDANQNEFQIRTGIMNMLQWEKYISGRVSEADVKKYYDTNIDFFNGVAVRASHIVIRTSPESTPGEKAQAQARLMALRQEIVAGKIDFAEAAKKNSQCATAPEGGDLGYFPRKWMVEEAIAATAFALKVGEVSNVVQTDYGQHLIKVTDRKPGQQSDFNKIKDQVREFCIEEMRQALLQQERRTAKIQVNLK